MESFDYVVVGAGSAGCVLAARLSEEAGTRVLLLEAGPRDRHPLVHVPAGFPRLFRGRLDWDYWTVPQPALGGRRVYWPRGRVLGGSSSLNAMMWVRGFRADYDEWGGLAGPGWSFESLLPYFRRIEDTEGVAAGDRWHGVGGPVPVAALRDPNPYTRRFLEAAAEVGIGPDRRRNEGEQEGAGETLATQRRGRRVSAADAYLRPARHRSNLVVRTGAACTGITFEGRRATGVTYRQGRTRHQAAARQEVLLAAGAIGSPQLLLCSGIGPGAHLASLGLPVLADRPAVGERLQDHLVSGVGVAARQPVTLAGAQSPAALARYLLSRRGPLTSTVAEGLAFVRSEPGLPLADLELLFLPAPFLEEGLVLPRSHGVSLGAVLLRPRSAGTLRLASPDPAVHPLVDPRYLSDPDGRDRAVLAAGIRRCLQVLAAPSLAQELGELLQPAGAADEEEVVARAIVECSQTLYHPVGTCAMGRRGEDVLDPCCRVRGVAGLRVVDASAFPALLRGHTHAPVLALAERVADLLRGRAAPEPG